MKNISRALIFAATALSFGALSAVPASAQYWGHPRPACPPGYTLYNDQCLDPHTAKKQAQLNERIRRKHIEKFGYDPYAQPQQQYYQRPRHYHQAPPPGYYYPQQQPYYR